MVVRRAFECNEVFSRNRDILVTTPARSRDQFLFHIDFILFFIDDCDIWTCYSYILITVLTSSSWFRLEICEPDLIVKNTTHSV